MIDPLLNARMLADQLTSLGVELPPDTARALGAVKAAHKAAAEQPVTDLAERIEAGILDLDKIADELRTAATQLATTEVARKLAVSLNGPLGKLAGRAIDRDVRRIIADLRPTFDVAAGNVAACTFDPETPPDRILAQGAEAAAAHQQVTGAARTLDAIANVRSRWYRSGQHPVAAYLADVRHLDHLARAQSLFDNNHGTGGRWLRLTRAGYRLQLNTPRQARELTEAAQQATTAAEQAAKRAAPVDPRQALVERLTALERR